jgi:hypothetical protein
MNDVRQCPQAAQADVDNGPAVDMALAVTLLVVYLALSVLGLISSSPRWTDPVVIMLGWPLFVLAFAFAVGTLRIVIKINGHFKQIDERMLDTQVESSDRHSCPFSCTVAIRWGAMRAQIRQSLGLAPSAELTPRSAAASADAVRTSTLSGAAASSAVAIPRFEQYIARHPAQLQLLGVTVNHRMVMTVLATGMSAGISSLVALIFKQY